MKLITFSILIFFAGACTSLKSPSEDQKKLVSIKITEDIYYISKLYHEAGYFSTEAITELTEGAEEFCVDSGFMHSQILPKESLVMMGIVSNHDDRPARMQGKFANPSLHYMCSRAPKITNEGEVLINCLDRNCDYLRDIVSIPDQHNDSIKVFEMTFNKISAVDEPYEHGVYFTEAREVVELGVKPENDAFMFGVEFKYTSRGLTTNLVPLSGHLSLTKGELGGNTQWMTLLDEGNANEYFLTTMPSSDEKTLIVKVSVQ